MERIFRTPAQSGIDLDSNPLVSSLLSSQSDSRLRVLPSDYLSEYWIKSQENIVKFVRIVRT
jgi:hypothetical protein